MTKLLIAILANVVVFAANAETITYGPIWGEINGKYEKHLYVDVPADLDFTKYGKGGFTVEIYQSIAHHKQKFHSGPIHLTDVTQNPFCGMTKGGFYQTGIETRYHFRNLGYLVFEEVHDNFVPDCKDPFQTESQNEVAKPEVIQYQCKLYTGQGLIKADLTVHWVEWFKGGGGFQLPPLKGQGLISYSIDGVNQTEKVFIDFPSNAKNGYVLGETFAINVKEPFGKFAFYGFLYGSFVEGVGSADCNSLP